MEATTTGAFAVSSTVFDSVDIYKNHTDTVETRKRPTAVQIWMYLGSCMLSVFVFGHCLVLVACLRSAAIRARKMTVLIVISTLAAIGRLLFGMLRDLLIIQSAHGVLTVAMHDGLKWWLWCIIPAFLDETSLLIFIWMQTIMAIYSLLNSLASQRSRRRCVTAPCCVNRQCYTFSVTLVVILCVSCAAIFTGLDVGKEDYTYHPSVHLGGMDTLYARAIVVSCTLVLMFLSSLVHLVVIFRNGSRRARGRRCSSLVAVVIGRGLSHLFWTTIVITIGARVTDFMIIDGNDYVTTTCLPLLMYSYVGLSFLIYAVGLPRLRAEIIAVICCRSLPSESSSRRRSLTAVAETAS